MFQSELYVLSKISTAPALDKFIASLLVVKSRLSLKSASPKEAIIVELLELNVPENILFLKTDRPAGFTLIEEISPPNAPKAPLIAVKRAEPLLSFCEKRIPKSWYPKD